MRTVRISCFVLAVAGHAVLAQQSWTIPGVVKAAGQNATNFVSDVVLTNPGPSPAFVLLQFAPALGALPVPYTLNPGASLTLTDVVATTFGASQAVGALTVMSDQPLILRGRTYNTASSGTFGVALPVVASDRFFGEGDSADSLWIDQEAASDRGYRTNLAVLFPDSAGGAATVTLFDAAGNEAGHQEFSRDRPGLQQFGAAGALVGPLGVGRARIRVTRGRATGYAVVVDNVTGDGSLYPFEDLPAGVQDVVLNGVSRAGGQNGTFWRSDVRLYNPADADAVVAVSFHAAGNVNPSPLTVSVTAPAGRIVDLPDVLGSLVGLPVGSSGALRFRSDAPVAVLCRTSNLDPAGVRPGTFGAQQKAVPLSSYLSSADAGALVSGVRQGGAYRTNVGFAAGADGATYALTLRSPSGGMLSAASGSLGAFGWTQPNVGSLFPASIPDGSLVVVKVTTGSLDVYDSAIDNGSGDPVVTSAARLPETLPPAATIGPAGGAVRSADGRLTLKVPAGAVAAPTAFSIQPASSPAPNGGDSGYVVAPDASFARDVLLVLSFTRQEAENVDALGLAYQNGADWYGVTGGTLDVGARTLTVPLGQTRPASLAGAVRASLAGPGATYGSYRGVDVSHWLVGAVVAGSARTVDFSVSTVGPGSAQQSRRGAVKLVKSAPAAGSWYVEGVAGGGGAAGRISGFPIGRYTAPACVPASNPVHLDAVLTGTTKVLAHASVWVFPRSWDLRVTWLLECRCSPGPTDGTFGEEQFGNTMRGSFTLDDNVSPIDLLTPLGGKEQTTVQPVLCPLVPKPSCGYRAAHLENYPGGLINTVTGGWDPSAGRLALNLDFTSPGVPSFTLSGSTCSPPEVPNVSAQLGFTPMHQSYSTSPSGFSFSTDSASAPVLGSEGLLRWIVDITPSPGCR